MSDNKYTASTCEYPVPEWIKVRISGGNFLSGIEADNCPLYKTKADIIEKEKL